MMKTEIHASKSTKLYVLQTCSVKDEQVTGKKDTCRTMQFSPFGVPLAMPRIAKNSR